MLAPLVDLCPVMSMSDSNVLEGAHLTILNEVRRDWATVVERIEYCEAESCTAKAKSAVQRCSSWHCLGSAK